MRRHRTFTTVVVVMAALASLTACSSDGGSTTTSSQPTWGAIGADEPVDYEYVIPYGTSVRIDQGQTVDLMPRELNVKVGQSIRIRNQDGRDYMVGPFFVTAGQSLAMRFTHPGQLSGVCTMNPEGEFVINISE